MTIDFTCPKCGNPFRMTAQEPNTRVPCPRCGSAILVPARPHPAATGRSSTRSGGGVEPVQGPPPIPGRSPAQVGPSPAVTFPEQHGGSPALCLEDAETGGATDSSTVGGPACGMSLKAKVFAAASTLLLIVIAAFLAVSFRSARQAPGSAIPEPEREAPRFDARNFGATLQWAGTLQRALGRRSQTASENQLLAEQVEQEMAHVGERLQLLDGQRVTWQLPVAHIGREYVSLQTFWPEANPTAPLASPMTLALSFVETNGHPPPGNSPGIVSWNAVTRSRAVLKVGRDIPFEQAAELRRGQSLRITGTVHRVGLAAGEQNDVFAKLNAALMTGTANRSFATGVLVQLTNVTAVTHD